MEEDEQLDLPFDGFSIESVGVMATTKKLNAEINTHTAEELEPLRSEGEMFLKMARRWRCWSKMIWVTFEKEGIHCYPAAAEYPQLRDVSFLAHPHRHMFKFRVEIEVFHDDRDIEFILFKRELEALYAGGVLEMNHKSCEMLAQELGDHIMAKYPGRDLIVTVSEDGENGATLKFSPN